MDWTIAGVVVALVALFSGWYWWWKPRQSLGERNSLANVELDAKAESGKISSEVELDETFEGDAGNVKIGNRAKAQDITTKVTTKTSGTK